MPGQYRQNQTYWIDDGRYGSKNDRFSQAIQDRIEASYKAQGWALSREDREEGQTMGPGCGIGRGWLSIVEGLNQRLAEIDPNYEIHQIKEKFGALRYYAIPNKLSFEEARNGEFRQLIREAEAKSAVTCEICGDEGMIAGPTWLKCRCVDHRKT